MQKDYKKSIFLIYKKIMNLHSIREVERFLIPPKDRINIINSADNNIYYPTVLDKISFVYYTLAHNHYFVDGNKRTATAFLISSLNASRKYSRKFNNINPIYLNDFLKKLVVAIASGHIRDRRQVKETLNYILNHNIQ